MRGPIDLSLKRFANLLSAALLWPKWRAALLHFTSSPMPRFVSRPTLGSSSSLRTEKQEIRMCIQHQLLPSVHSMLRFYHVNLLKWFLALPLIGFLLHPGRFAVLQYQLLDPLPVWQRCTLVCQSLNLLCLAPARALNVAIGHWINLHPSQATTPLCYIMVLEKQQQVLHQR